MKKSQTSQALEQWHRGDPRGLESLLELHIPSIRVALDRRLNHGGSKGDVLRDAALEFLLYGPRILIEDDRLFSRLLAMIVENALKNRYDWYPARRRHLAKSHPIPGNVVLLFDGTGAGRKDALEERAWIRLGMEFLDPVDREIIMMRQWDGLSFPEIAERQGMDEEATRIRHNRTVAELAAKVGRLRKGDLRALFETPALGPEGEPLIRFIDAWYGGSLLAEHGEGFDWVTDDSGLREAVGDFLALVENLPAAGGAGR